MNPYVPFQRRGALLASVSAVALMIAWQPATAADLGVAAPIEAPPPVVDTADIWVAAEGRFNIFNGNSVAGDVYSGGYYGGNILNADPKDGWSGSLELGARPAGSPWDYVGRVTFGRANPGSDSFYNYSYYGDSISGEAETNETHIIADFEVGRHVGVGLQHDTRIHAGVQIGRAHV